MVVYDLETFDTIKCIAYSTCIYRLSKILGKYNRDILEKEYQKGRKDFFVFKGLDNFNERNVRLRFTFQKRTEKT